MPSSEGHRTFAPARGVKLYGPQQHLICLGEDITHVPVCTQEEGLHVILLQTLVMEGVLLILVEIREVILFCNIVFHF